MKVFTDFNLLFQDRDHWRAFLNSNEPSSSPEGSEFLNELNSCALLKRNVIYWLICVCISLSPPSS
jgi:hypothetical protein